MDPPGKLDSDFLKKRFGAPLRGFHGPLAWARPVCRCWASWRADPRACRPAWPSRICWGGNAVPTTQQTQIKHECARLYTCQKEGGPRPTFGHRNQKEEGLQPKRTKSNPSAPHPTFGHALQLKGKGGPTQTKQMQRDCATPYVWLRRFKRKGGGMA